MSSVGRQLIKASLEFTTSEACPPTKKPRSKLHLGWVGGEAAVDRREEAAYHVRSYAFVRSRVAGKKRANENPGVGSAQEERARFERSGTIGRRDHRGPGNDLKRSLSGFTDRSPNLRRKPAGRPPSKKRPTHI